MNPYDESLLIEAVNNVSPRMVGGGQKLRGPNATFDFIYSVWIEKALLMTRQLPMMFEYEGNKYRHHKKLLEEVGRKGVYTETYGWSENRDFLHDFSVTPSFYNYFSQVIGPFMGNSRHGSSKAWADENSRIWKRIKAMIVEGDKIKISKFAKTIEARLLKESGKSIIKVATSGTDTQKSIIEAAS